MIDLVNHIVVDQNGRRFMNEWTSYYSDTGARAMDYFDSDAVKYPRVPSYFISTEQGRLEGPWGSVTFNMPGVDYKNWSDDNLTEIESGMIKKFDTLTEVAEFIGCDVGTLSETFDKVNAGNDEFNRPDECAIDLTAPYYVAPVFPIVGNTQGGPRHNLNHQPINPFGEVVDKDVYVIGDCGSSFGWLYMSAGNWAECFVSAKNSVHHIKKSQ